MHAALRSALFGSALPLAGFELGMDFRAGWYRSGAVVTRDPAALPGYSFTRDRAKWDNVGGVLIPAAVNQPGIIPGVGYAAREPFTNFAPNSSWNGMAVGGSSNPGMSLSLGTTRGMTVAVAGKGVEGGLDYIDLRVSGTASNTASPGAIVFLYPVMSGAGATSHPAAQPGDFWTHALSARLVGGSVAGFTTLTFNNSYRDDSGAIVYNAPGPNFLGADPTITRRSVVQLPAAPAASTRAFSHLSFGIPDGATVDITVRLFGLSMNKSAIEFPHIATGGGSVSTFSDNMRFTQPLPTNEDWVIVSAATTLRTSSQHTANGNKRYWRILDGTIERIGVYRNVPIQNGAQGRINAIVTGADGDAKRPAGGDIPQAGRMVSVVRKVGTSYSIATRAPDGTVQIGGAQQVAQFPSPLVDIHLAPELEGYHEFFGWRRGTFSDAQIIGMLAALA